MAEGITNPVIVFKHYAEDEAEDLQIKSAADMGALIFDGFCDGIFLLNEGNLHHTVVEATAFGILPKVWLVVGLTQFWSRGAGKAANNKTGKPATRHRVAGFLFTKTTYEEEMDDDRYF